MNTEQRKQQMQDILRNTVDYYRVDPQGRRSVTEDGDCMYTWGDNHCAIGRYMKPEFKTEEFEMNEGVGVNGLGGDIDEFLIKKVHGIELLFWRDLQEIHDIVGHWEEWHEHGDGVRKYELTDRGKETYVGMQDKIIRGEYDND